MRPGYLLRNFAGTSIPSPMPQPPEAELAAQKAAEEAKKQEEAKQEEQRKIAEEERKKEEEERRIALEKSDAERLQFETRINSQREQDSHLIQNAVTAGVIGFVGITLFLVIKKVFRKVLS